MNALILGLLLAQSTAGIQISVRVVRPRCVVLDGAGVARVEEVRAIRPGDVRVGCTSDPAAGRPRIEQRVEIAAAGGAPEQRLIEITY